VGGKMIEKATIEKVIEALEEKLAMVGDAV
jgi:hypothetical protein